MMQISPTFKIRQLENIWKILGILQLWVFRWAVKNCSTFVTRPFAWGIDRFLVSNLAGGCHIHYLHIC
jgi:hypothetical protein